MLGVASGLLTVVGFAGLWLYKLIQNAQGVTEHEFMASTAGAWAVWALSASLLLGLLVLFPLSVYLQRRAGVPLPGPVVPNWLACPIVGVLLLGALLLVLLITVVILTKLLGLIR